MARGSKGATGNFLESKAYESQKAANAMKARKAAYDKSEAESNKKSKNTTPPVKEQNILQKILFGDKEKEMSLAEAKRKAIQNQGRTKDLFGNELNYVNVLNKAGIGYNDIKEIRKYANRPDLAARNFYENILEKQIAANPINSDLLQRMTDYEVPLDEQGDPMFDSYKRIGIGDEELYGNPLANVPFLSGLGSIIPNTRNKIAGFAADAVVGFPGATSMARGLMDKIAGGSGDYTAAQRYFKNYFPDDQEKVNQLALASLDPKFQRDIFENPVFEASQNYDKARNTLPEKEQAAPLGLAALATPTPTPTNNATNNATIYSNNATGNTTNNATGNTTNNATAFSPYASTANYKSLGIPQVVPNAPGGFSGAFPGYYDYLTKYFGR